MEQYILWGLTTLVSAFVGAFLAGYLRKKGENWATHEDIDKLVEQVAAVTTTTKKIEAKISDELWQRQKRWEAKRDALFDVMKELAGVQYHLQHLLASHMAQKGNFADPDFAKEFKKQKHDSFHVAFQSFERAKWLAMVVCSQPVRDKFDSGGSNSNTDHQ